MLEALDLGPRHAHCHSLVVHIQLVVHSGDELGCVAQGERLHLRAQANEIDDQIAFGIVYEIAHFFGVEISISTSELRKVAITYLAKVDGVSEVRPPDDLFNLFFNKTIKKKRVGVGVEHSD